MGGALPRAVLRGRKRGGCVTGETEADGECPQEVTRGQHPLGCMSAGSEPVEITAMVAVMGHNHYPAAFEEAHE